MSVPPFDVSRLGDRLLAADVLTGPIHTLRRIGDGHSNLTYAVSDGGRAVVVRRPPPPPVPPGANDVLREARIQQALAGTAVPVPRILAVDDTCTVMDVPFYVMELLDGDVATTVLPAALDDDAGRRGLGEALIDVLAAVHGVDWQAVGLGDLGRPDGFLERQLRKLPRLVADTDGAVPACFTELGERLAADMPESGPATIVHGDLRLGNVMLARTSPARILGVLDWELAAIGDPLADVGYTLATYAVPDEPLHALTALSTATLAPGFPSREELADRYAAATGRDVSALPWYQALALWKLALLFEYGRRRAAGPGGDPYYATPGLVDGLLTAAHRALSPSAQPTARSTR